MYAMRFEGEDVSKMTMQQLRGREGARVRGVYRKMAKKTGVKWDGREYDVDDYESGDPVNKALSAANACLYGVAHSVIAAIGCSPGLGFIHTGHERSFVYDVADLYKAELTIPTAFKVAAGCGEKDDIGALTRRAVRDAINDGHILTRMVKDIRTLLLDTAADNEIETDILTLWDDKQGTVASGVSYADGKCDPDADDDADEEGYGQMV
jgi:CRISPR-associated protein Cas1